MKAIWFKAPKTASTSIRAALLGFADTIKDFDRHRTELTPPQVLQILVDFFPFGKINGWYLGSDFPSKTHVCQVNGDQWYSYSQRYSGFYKQAYKFAVCRHPLERFISGYRYVDSELGLSVRSVLEILLTGSSGATQQLGGYAYEHLRPLHHFVPNDDETHNVDKLIRFESLQSDFDIVCRRLGIPKTSLPFTRKGKRLDGPSYNVSNYMDLFDDTTEAMAREYFAKDFKIFNYT